MKKIVLASDNLQKLHEYQEILRPLDIEPIPLKDLHLSLDGLVENKNDFMSNAQLKANFIADKTNLPVLADDSGLAIKAFNGFPGIFSHRFMDGYSYHEKNKVIISMLDGWPNRQAEFHCAIAYLDEKHIFHGFSGIAFGTIAFHEHGENGFGYDPIFLSDEIGKTFAEATENEKNRFSHRAKATKKLLEFLSINQ